MTFSEFEPGKEAFGHVPVLADGDPIFYVCGQYRLSRAKTAAGILWDAWFKPRLRELPLQLEGGVSHHQALKACQDHANGLSA